MKLKQQSPVWPYLGILACLFVLSVTAPRAWDRMARKDTLRQVLSERQPRSAASQVTFERPNPVYEVMASEELIERKAIDEATDRKTQPAPEPVAEVVPPLPEFAEEVREPGVEVANRPGGPAAEAPMELPRDEAPAEPDYQPAIASSTWPLPRVLVEQLTQLAQEEPSAIWAEQATGLIYELCRPTTENSRSAMDIIKDLRALGEDNATATAADPPRAAQIIRVQYALARWLDIWESAAALDRLVRHDDEGKAVPQRIAVCLADVEALTSQGSSGTAWREYLQLDGLKRLASDQQEPTEDERRTAARQVLDRLNSSRLSRTQRKFVSEGPLAALQTELRSWAAEPITAARLLAHVEQYERSGLASDARLVANDSRGLSWSAPSAAEKISQHLETHYRNANLRIAVSSALVNRMIPQPQKIEAAVSDTVMNVPVYGRSTTFTKVSARFVPDPRRIRVGLEASGLVASDTVSTSGPAKFHNSGQSTFLVRKLLVLGPQGLSVWPAVSEAENNYTYLVSLETDFDGVPLVGSLVRSIARSQHDDARDEARMEVEQKVAMRARDQFDAEVRPHLVKAAESVQKKQLATLNRLGLELVPLALSTTQERIAGRMRVAGTEQLGAHTPRPRAPSDSWFSLQVHQSALNNVIERLDLEGRTFALPELFAWLAEKLDRPQLTNQDDLPEDVRVTFAQKDAVRLRCNADRVEVTFAIAELVQRRNRWRDFAVRTFYWPEAEGLSPQFTRDAGQARDSTIHLEGKSLKGKPQLVLRAIFSKVLSRNRDLRLLDEKLTSDPRLNDLEITQFIIDDGWIGLAYSPRRAPSQMARQLNNAQRESKQESGSR
ncbi:MAG: hypothetical protein HY288_00945 [Planctomycetia bacterium]|nr:hypothetical protein [Planctomycetia bacterium]